MKDFRTPFKKEAQAKNLFPRLIVEHCILKAVDAHLSTEEAYRLASYFIHKAFSPIRNKKKLDNGKQPHDALYETLRYMLPNPTKLIAKRDNVENSQLKPLIGDVLETDTEANQFNYIVSVLREKYVNQKSATSQNREYVYIFVRQDISPEYQLVQAAHAASHMGYNVAKQGKVWGEFKEVYFAVVGVPDVKGLEVALKDCVELGLGRHSFFEPDIGNELTAIATNPIRAKDRKRLLSYKKLRFKKQ